MKDALRIVIADDHALFRAGLKRLLETERGFEVVGEASSGEDALAQVERLAPDLLLLDLSMPRTHGLEALRELSRSNKPVQTLLLTAAIETDQIIEALQLGARGVVLKDVATELLFKAIRAVAAGEHWVGRERVSDLVATLRTYTEKRAVPPEEPGATFGLSPRELGVVAEVIGGLSNREIARKLAISENTVKHHLSSIFDKLGVSNRLELALFAVHHRIVPDS